MSSIAKTVFNETEYSELMKKVEGMTPESKAGWGKMDAAQMLAHVNLTIETGLGVTSLPSESNWFTRTIIKPLALRRTLMKNSPTAKSFRMKEEKDFSTEKQKLLRNLKMAHERGANGAWKPHISFGPLTGEEWGALIFKHASHHMEQFGR